MSNQNSRIKDIALLAGVSIGTVDRVLHNRGEVALDTREKILLIASDLNYSPNLMARALKTKRVINFVILLPEATENNPFWYKHQHGIDKAMNELSSFSVKLSYITYNGLNEEDFKIKSKEILKDPPDGLILAPVFKQKCISFCNQLTNKHIPYVFIDTFIKEVDFLTFVGEEAYQSGRVAAQLIDYGTNQEKDIVIINITKNIESISKLNIRTKGFLSYFSDAGLNTGLKISVEIKTPDEEEINKTLDRVFQQNKNIGAMFITNSKAHYIANYIEKNKIKNINIVGYDLIDLNTRYLQMGYIKFLISQRPIDQTERGIKKLFDFIISKRVPIKIEYLPIDVITSENLSFFI